MSSSSKKNSMILYTEESEIHSHRIRIVLAEKGVAYDQVIVDPAKPSQELIELNPSLSLPTLVDRDLVLYGSETIMEYLDERFPHPPLMPVYPVARARCRMLIHRINADWYDLIPKIQAGDQESKQKLIDSIVSISPILDETLFFTMEEFTLVDCCVAPLFLRLKSWGCELPPQAAGVLSYMKKIFKRESLLDSLSPVEKTMLSAVISSING